MDKLPAKAVCSSSKKTFGLPALLGGEDSEEPRRLATSSP